MANPHLLLFGPPGAGKSSLLEALAQAAPALKTETVSQATDMQRVKLQPGKGAKSFSEVTVLDCSGKAALEMLQTPEPFAKSHPIKKPILDADGVVVVLDVSAPKKQLGEELHRVVHWLAALHDYRVRRADVAAFPVYVVLTKCDQLAKPDDTLETWKARVESVRRQYLAQLNKSLELHSAFGSLDIHLIATAVTLPTFGAKSAKNAEPLGIADLFQQSTTAAADYQDRSRRSQGRLQNVVAGLAAVIAILGLMVAFLIEFQPEAKSTALDERVLMILPRPNTSAARRLQGTPDRLEVKLKNLIAIENDPEFGRLHSETRDKLTAYRAELGEYLRLTNEAEPRLKLPHLAKNQQELDRQEKDLASITLTKEQADAWAETRLARRLKSVRGEYDALHKAIDIEVAWIQKEAERTQKVLKESSRIYGQLLGKEKGAQEEAAAWMKQVAQLHPRPHQPRDEYVPGVSRMIWEDLGKFDKVKQAYKDWVAAKSELSGIAKLIENKMKS